MIYDVYVYFILCPRGKYSYLVSLRKCFKSRLKSRPINEPMLNYNLYAKIFVKRNDMRLDKFLKVSRLIKRRTVANEVSDLGRVFVNGTQAKPSKQLKEGDIIKIENPNRSISAKVLIVPKGNVRVQEAPTLYEVIGA